MNEHAHLIRKQLGAAALVAILMASGTAIAQDALGGSELILPATAPLDTDMVILKTARIAGLNSFTVVVSNTGPVAVTGAKITDTGGTNGFCAKTNAVTITGDGVPEGSFTISNLNAPGIALGTLQPGQSATFTYSCQGN